MKNWRLALCAMAMLSCSHFEPVREAVVGVAAGRAPANVKRLRSHDDPILKQGDLTVWKLQELAQKGEFVTLENLFNNGVSLDRLPVGYATGTGARVLGLPTQLGVTVLDSLTGANWRGKIFFASSDPRSSRGLNRIRRVLNGDRVPILPMAAFTTKLLDSDPLVPGVSSNFVILNYAQPRTKDYWQELALTKIQVYDVMVAVPGKYGPVYVGKTWLGSYDKKGEFHAFVENRLVAWYFLDFNQAALEEQMESHWDDSPEEPIDYK